MHPEPENETSSPALVRLQKALAAAGIGSRRACEELISAGRVEVDGTIVTELGRRVDPRTAVVRVDGSRVNIRPDLVYLALNKPRGVLSAMSDGRGRPTIGDLVAGRPRNRGHLRARLLRAGLKEERCETCGIDEWRGQPLKVTLHHVNGDPYDNRLENLMFLCPNCHSQTSNFGGRNGRLREAPGLGAKGRRLSAA